MSSKTSKSIKFNKVFTETFYTSWYETNPRNRCPFSSLDILTSHEDIDFKRCFVRADTSVYPSIRGSADLRIFVRFHTVFYPEKRFPLRLRTKKGAHQCCSHQSLMINWGRVQRLKRLYYPRLACPFSPHLMLNSCPMSNVTFLVSFCKHLQTEKEEVKTTFSTVFVNHESLTLWKF